MNVLVTAGNAQVLIDRVRAITNIFTGRTGAGIALDAHQRGHTVTLLTSRPETVTEAAPAERWTLRSYQTFEDLQRLMEEKIHGGGFDVVIHSAAVSDYRPEGVFSTAPGTHFQQSNGCWVSEAGGPRMEDRAAGKVKSDVPELWLRLVRTPKLVDRIRTDWCFRGVLVKFKLEVGVSEEELLQIAERSRRQSNADLMVANTLEEASSWAYLGPLGGLYQRIVRSDLSNRLLEAVEQLHG
jgi:phosphopantothenoylcysteine synthetase/decarboxylase